jgi:predicted nucleic acid-binding protein
VPVRVYVDADVLIWHLRGERKAAARLRALAGTPETELWTGAMQRAEVLFFLRTGEEERTVSFLAQFRTQSVTQAIVDLAAALYRRWHPSHGTDVNDALLAASAATTGGRIVTQNVRHYPMPEVVVEKGW